MALQQTSTLNKLQILVQLEEEEAHEDYAQGILMLKLHQPSHVWPQSC